MTLNVTLKHTSYDIFLESDALKRAGELLNLDRRVMIITDSGVPKEYVRTVYKNCTMPVVFEMPQGEGSKSMDTFAAILTAMIENGFKRSDAVFAVGGGVVGDIAGFAAASYMRGVDFYNVPTTLLSQVDSSIGGKTGLNMGGIKNAVGAFYQPKRVLIDPELLNTLDERLFSEGLAEVIKMALISDAELFELIERGDVHENIMEIIERSLKIKKHFVETDERDEGTRKMLNFGHTIGHAIEAQRHDLYHGECVALGMLPMCSEETGKRLKSVLKRFGLLNRVMCDKDALYSSVCHDKKAVGDTITCAYVDNPGHGRLITMPIEDMKLYINALCESAI